MRNSSFYAVVGVSLVVTATSLGFSASRYLSLRYYSLPPPAASRGATTTPGEASTPPPERWTNIFAPSQGMEIPSRIASRAEDAAIESASATPYVLLGTVSSDTAEARRAILWADGFKEPKVLREKAELEPGVRLVRVERDHVWLARGGKPERLDILPVGSRTRQAAVPAQPAPAAARSPAPSPSPPPVGAAFHVSQIGENAYSLDEASVQQLTGNINQFMTQVRIIPYFEGNASAGYRLAAIRPGSPFEQLGFRGGDIIQSVNDVELSTPEKMYTIFQNLKDEKRVTVNILRQGIRSTLTYEIR
jgi:general secretion pathway protein C